MGVISKVKELFVTRETTQAQGKGETSGTPRTGGYLPYLDSASPAMCIATVNRCVKLLSESVAVLPLQYLRKRGEIFTEDEGNRLSWLLNVQPDDARSAFDMMRQLVQDVLLTGNAYVVPVLSPISPEVDRLVLVHPQYVCHDTTNDLYKVSDQINGVAGVYSEEEIIHVKGLPGHDPKKGISVIAHARLACDIAQVSDREARTRFANGGTVRGIIHNDQSVKGFGDYADDQLSELASALDAKINLAGERIVSTPGAAGFTPLTSTSVDMQFLESRKFTVREICRFFGVHPSFVFDDTSNNYKSAEMANVAFLSSTLNPLLRNIENEFQRKLIAPSLYGKRRIKFDRRGLYACDLESRVRYQQQTIAAGIYTVNDWRREENRPTVEGGDAVLVSANLKEINSLSLPSAPTTIHEPGETINDNKDGE